MENQNTFESFELSLSSTAKDFLKETAKWAYFLSILGFIMIGLLVLLGLFMGSVMGAVAPMGNISAFPTVFLTVIYIAMALLYFFPVLYLYKFGSKMKQAFAENDNESLEEGFKNLKSHYKFIGVLAIVMISFYALAFIFAIFGALVR